MTEQRELTTTEKDKAVAPKSTGTIRALLEGDVFKRQIAMVLPSHLTPERMVRVALTAMTRTPKLSSCDQQSFFRCLIDLASMGLEPDGRLAHLIPYENRKRGVVECQLIIDYKGLAALAMRSGMISTIHADVVCDEDVFEYNIGEIQNHKIDFRKPRGNVYAAYAIAIFKDGSRSSAVMTRDEIEAVRSRSRAGQSGPWVTDWNEMAKKTVFRRLSKWLPLSPEFRDSIDHDDDAIDVAAAPCIDIGQNKSRLDALAESLLGESCDDAGESDGQ